MVVSRHLVTRGGHIFQGTTRFYDSHIPCPHCGELRPLVTLYRLRGLREAAVWSLAFAIVLVTSIMKGWIGFALPFGVFLLVILGIMCSHCLGLIFKR